MVFGSSGSRASLCGQYPMSRGLWSGNQRAVIPSFIVFHVSPPFSVENTATAEMPTTIFFALLGSGRTVWRHNPPFPGFHFGRVAWDVRPSTSFHESPSSSERNRPAGSTPAYRTPGAAGPPPTTFQIFATLHPDFLEYAGPAFPRVHFVSVFERWTSGPHWPLFTAAHPTPSCGSYRAWCTGIPSKYRPASFHRFRSFEWNTYNPFRVPTKTTVMPLGIAAISTACHRGDDVSRVREDTLPDPGELPIQVRDEDLKGLPRGLHAARALRVLAQGGGQDDVD